MFYVTVDDLLGLGLSATTINNKLSKYEWQWRTVRPKGHRAIGREVLLSSLPEDLQVSWLRHITGSTTAQSQVRTINAADNTVGVDNEKLIKSIVRLPPGERAAWIAEAGRLACIVERYKSIKPKRCRDASTGKYKFVPAVVELCEQAVCSNLIILAREPHRINSPSPHTLDGWLQKYRDDGLLTFIRSAPIPSPNKPDGRRAEISVGAAEWIRSNWRNFKKPSHLFSALKKRSGEMNWVIPSKAWFYRLWNDMPEIVKTFHLEGQGMYISKHAPYVPRDYSDLQALQVLCGDHSERDVTVLLDDGTLARPWLSLWFDLRTALIWGWYLSLIPSSNTTALAYADGVENFGAQPFSLPDEGFFSYVYTDRGRDYLSHSWDGKVIAVHKQAMNIEGGLEFLLVHHQVGILDDFGVKHLVAKRQNAREKPVERVFRDISDWEQNNFREYCGRDAKHRPDRWRELYEEHRRFLRGELSESPFRSFDLYREELAVFITKYNSSVHERLTLGGAHIIPIEEYGRLYTTHYEISRETLALLVMKAEKRVIRKNGVQCFQKHWSYYHESMAEFKGLSVEIRFTDGDYSKVWVILPNGHICEAPLITPTSLISLNKRTVQAVAKAQTHERELIHNYNLLSQSRLRGETIEGRVAGRLETTKGNEKPPHPISPKGVVHKLTRMDRKKLQVSGFRRVTPSEVSAVKVDTSIFSMQSRVLINEIDYEDAE